ncbi:caspase family protein [Actinobacillus equuli subsp. haemolyticus]|uniref:caspase family protein n=1 Tax=Actinobacillus equuli TaxID=718 RepID=UPI002441EB1F|nr:caspase family protein [Actinobacillus equuli]WGE67050.1 caspase family protein [Actinobacillus equuli subsp. haemolyticus]
MKKKAIIIGNMDPNLGVQKDIDDTISFLKSKAGGAWNDNEIVVLKDSPSILLKYQLQQYKSEKLDYVFLLFGGHGDMTSNITNIYPSHKSNEALSEEIFNNLAPRQLSVLDCCRVPRKLISNNIVELSESASTEDFSVELSIEKIRELYHNQILQAPEQHLKLYACDTGEAAIDNNGGLYTQELISNAITASKVGNRVNSAILIHNKTKVNVQEKSANKQNPKTFGLPRLQDNLQLPLSINPKKFF